MNARIGSALMMMGAAVALAPATAHADRFEATRSDRLVEHAHDIKLTLDRGFATLVVQRTVFNGGARHDQATFWIDVPSGGVATSLRTLGTWRGKPRWFEGELMEAEAAAAKYQELTGIGGYYPKDPALLSWRSQDELALQVFPCPPDALKSVEYTLTLPAKYDDGRYAVTLPRLGTDEFIARVNVFPARRGDTVAVSGRAVEPGAPLTAAGELRVELIPSAPPRLDAHLAVISTGERYAVRYELAVAPQISQIPKGLAAVVVVDTSASLAAEEVEAQLAAAGAYLRQLADPKLRAKAAVVTFDREARVLGGGGLRPVRTVLAALESFDPTQRNGSHVDVALQTAQRLLGRTNKNLRRVVLMSDALMRQDLTAPRVAALSGATGAVTHVAAVMDSGTPTVFRSTTHRWRHVARQSGGLAWDAEISTDPHDRDAMDNAYLEWARPVRIHDPVVFAPGLDEDINFPDTMDEGFGTAVLSLQDEPVRHVIVSGELWSQPLHEVFVPEDDFADRWSALIFGSEAEGELSEEEAMVLAMRGGAVSPVTSYLAIEPGVRPSTEGLEEGEAFGVGGLGLVGRGSGGGFGSAARSKRRPFDRGAFLSSQIRAAATSCGVPESVNVEVQLQTTRAEIAAIDRVEFVGYLDNGQRDCLREGIWSVALPRQFNEAWKQWTLGA